MDIYKLNFPGNITPEIVENYSLAIGFFDGVHKGHQAVINEAIKRAKELNIQSAVMTFDPHPSHVIANGKNKVAYITPFEEKCRLFRSMGVDTVFIVTFNQSLAALSPKEFIATFIKKLGVKHVTAGFDFRFGARGAGTMEQMTENADGVFGTTVVGKVIDSEDEISSTRIRKLVAQGNVKAASHLLGRNFKMVGTVVDGEKNGRKLGFPTANVLPVTDAIFPGNGVYAVHFTVDGKVYNGVSNVGIKPTFNNPDVKVPVVEVHLFGFDGDLYGKKVAVDLVEKIREEKKFDSLDALIEQITKDKETALKILETQ